MVVMRARFLRSNRHRKKTRAFTKKAVEISNDPDVKERLSFLCAKRGNDAAHLKKDTCGIILSCFSVFFKKP